MRTNGLPWLQHDALPGLSTKHLAYFFESGPNLKLLRIAKGASLPGATPVGHRAVFLLEGEIDFQGAHFDALSYFVLPSDEAHAAMQATEDAVLLFVAWSPQGQRVPYDLF